MENDFEMESIIADVPCPYCRRKIHKLDDDNAEKVTTTQYCVYCECGESFLYDNEKFTRKK
jgi:hypothetical protein